MAGQDPRQWQGPLGSMRVRVIAVVVLLQLVSSVIAVLVLRQVLFERLDDEVTVNLRQEAEEFRLLRGGIDPRTGEPFGDDHAALFDVYFSREVPDEGETLLAFVGGELYAERRSRDAAATDQLTAAIAYWSSLDEPRSGSLETELGTARYVAIPLPAAGADPAGLFVVANFPAFERGEIDEAVQAHVVTQLVALLVASLLGLALASRVLRPLRLLARTAQRISDTDLARRIPVRGRDEASQIAATFNDMLSRLEQVFRSQRRFLDDAGHELKAPLTVIRGHVELLAHEPDPAERAATVDLVTDEIDRMSRIVGDLVLLARAEQPDFLQPTHGDLRTLMEDIHRKVRALGDRTWRVALPAAVPVNVDHQRLTQAVVQLCDNACRHTPPGSVIDLGAAVDAEGIRLWVRDRGAGIAPADAERIFERFRRGSTPVADGRIGAGLGLSIVRVIAEAHGGTVALAYPEGGGAHFELRLPRNCVVAATVAVADGEEDGGGVRGPVADGLRNADGGTSRA